MANKREPVLQTISIMSLRPTQMTVGMREVKEKRKRWRAHKSRKRAELLGRRMIPVVLGPDKNHYVIDHHHMARALHEEGEEVVLVSVVADLTMVDKNAFWVVRRLTMDAIPVGQKYSVHCKTWNEILNSLEVA